MGVCDKPVWTASKKGSYVSSEAWEALREKRDEVIWWKMVWFPLAIPKHAFIMWLAMKYRLLTGERLLKMGYKGEVQCSFCHSYVETRDHLFFECSFSSRIWKFCMLRCIVEQPPTIWDDILQLGCKSWGKKSLLCHLVFGSVVYNIWHTRNEIRHAGSLSTGEQILKKVMWKVHTRLAGRSNFPRTRENIFLSSLWNLPNEMLENEHLNNIGKYRAVKEVPLSFRETDSNE